MKVRFEVITKGVKNKNHAMGQFLFKREDLINDFSGKVQKEFLPIGMINKEFPEFVRDG